MKTLQVGSIVVATLMFAFHPPSGAAQRLLEDQIAEAVTPLRETDRSGATVLAYSDGTTLERVREGTNHFICLADSPGDAMFRVTCYHDSLDPFMARGREIRAAGGSRGDVRRIRKLEVDAGELSLPQRALLITLSGTRSSDGSAPDSVTSLNVIYLPYATADEIGMSTVPQGMGPWLMDPGQHRAHVMIAGPLRPLHRY